MTYFTIRQFHNNLFHNNKDARTQGRMNTHTLFRIYQAVRRQGRPQPYTPQRKRRLSILNE